MTQYVFESPHVGHLMAIGKKRIAIDDKAKLDTGMRFGTGWTDEQWAGQVALASQIPELMLTDQELVDQLHFVSALMVAWCEDIEARSLES